MLFACDLTPDGAVVGHTGRPLDLSAKWTLCPTMTVMCSSPSALHRCHRDVDTMFELVGALSPVETVTSLLNCSLQIADHHERGSLYDTMAKGRDDAAVLEPG
jgi:hypothetical protein